VRLDGRLLPELLDDAGRGPGRPVDVYIPGCPPRPEQVLDALVLLQERIQRGEGHSQVVIKAEKGGFDVPAAAIKPRTAHLPGGETKEG
jgi:hypothetical protein